MPSIGRLVRVEPNKSDHNPAHAVPPVGVPTFASIYESYFKFVWTTTRHLGIGLDDLDDVVQTVFVTIHERLPSIERPESLRSWIYGIVRRVVSAHYRSQRARLTKTRMAQLETRALQEDWPTPQQQAEQSEDAKLLMSLLEGVGPLKREMFLLTELEDMTAPEIAEAVGIPINTVYSRVRAARIEIEEALKRHQARIKKRSRSRFESHKREYEHLFRRIICGVY